MIYLRAKEFAPGLNEPFLAGHSMCLVELTHGCERASVQSPKRERSRSALRAESRHHHASQATSDTPPRGRSAAWKYPDVPSPASYRGRLTVVEAGASTPRAVCGGGQIPLYRDRNRESRIKCENDAGAFSSQWFSTSRHGLRDLALPRSLRLQIPIHPFAEAAGVSNRNTVGERIG